MSKQNKFYPEIVDITIDLEKLQIITETNLLKHLSSRISFDGLDEDTDVDMVHDTIESWLPSDEMVKIFENAEKVIMLRVGTVLTMGVHKGNSSLMFGFDSSDNTVTIDSRAIIRRTTITITSNEEINSLIAATIPLYIQSLVEFPMLDGEHVKHIR